MKIIIETQFNEIGDEYMNQGEETVEIFTNADSVYVKINEVQYKFPKEVFKGIL